MSTCLYCGAPLKGSPESPRTCDFCDRVNEPAPREVEVPVPVQVVHKVVQVVGDGASGSPEARELRCPHCRRRLVAVVAKGVELNGCGGCGGIWIDNASARRVLASPEAIFTDLARRAGENAKHAGIRAPHPSCPACTAVLDRAFTRGIELDVCPEHGTWFDPFELGTLVDVLTGKPPRKEFRPGDTREVQCAGCRQGLTADRANVTQRGLLCETCWRALNAESLATAEREAQKAGAVAVGGALLGVAAIMLGAAAAGSRSD